ncbi:hypothetical protein ABIB15_002944 [Marisediminicola sp. UYEF4]|uniref:hypothetical protein n=1 Tax=Marisediminicola sp. UYEF4 TaxID=1756384 RepID=UPI00339724DF
MIVVSQPAIAVVPGGGTLSTVLFSAALLIFAFGIRRAGSITARRPLGTAALTVLAVWLLLDLALAGVVASSISSDTAPTAVLAFAYVNVFVQFLLALVAVMQIGRLGVVPSPWNWAPAWALAAVSASWLLTQVLGALGTTQGAIGLSNALMSLESLTRTGGTVLIAVLAIVLADRMNRPQPTADTSISEK